MQRKSANKHFGVQINTRKEPVLSLLVVFVSIGSDSRGRCIAAFKTKKNLLGFSRERQEHSYNTQHAPYIEIH